MGEGTVGMTPPRVMTIAGTDSGGGAGVAADLRALAACGVHGCVAVTAVTVQNSVGVTGVHTLPPETVAAQIEAVATDIGLDAVKTGMLATTPIIWAIAEACDGTGIGGDGPTPLIVDPVAASMHGDPLLVDSALGAYRTVLFPRATVVTPNLDEVRLLVGIDVRDRAGQYEAARMLHALGPRHVLVKGGHLAADTDVCVDLHYDGRTFTELRGPRYDTGNTHGPVTTPLPKKVLASRVTVIILQTSHPPASPAPTGDAAAPAQPGFLDSVLGQGNGPIPADSTQSSQPDPDPMGQNPTDPVDSTFAVGAMKFFGHQPI